MSRIKNLYTHLVTHQRAAADPWLEDYQKFTGEVSRIRDALISNHGIQDQATYAGTSFATMPDPWPEFSRKLIYELSNGVSSRGQSSLHQNNFAAFTQSPPFIDAVAALIRNSDKPNFIRFAAAWEAERAKVDANKNPLLVNRVLAACTLDVTSTVNEPDLHRVYDWLVNESFLPGKAVDWYDRNVQLMNYLKVEFDPELKSGETNLHLLSMFVWFLRENLDAPYTLNKQVVRYGAPGTGKTYSARRDTKVLFQIWQDEFDPATSFDYEDHCEVVQFHPSFGYEDFMEGLRPVPDAAGGEVRLILQNGVFKQLCKRAGIWEADVHLIPDVGPELAKNWAALTIGDILPHRENLGGAHWRHLLGHAHPDKKVADAAPPYFIIIDEINRAELSRVMGELMLSLEYRGTGGAISTQYAALNDGTTGLVKIGTWKFFVPHNVYLIGTMNNIDRSVESFDLALRRRFRWERVDPDLATLRYHFVQRDRRRGANVSQWQGLEESLRKLNKAISGTPGFSRDHEIGHAYLMDRRYPESLTREELRDEAWHNAILPLLEEYLRGNDHETEILRQFKAAFFAQ